MTEAEELELLELEAQAAAPRGGTPDLFFQDRGPKTIQEEHPALSVGDRLIIKNLSTNPESSINYLKKKYPDMDVQQNASGQIILKKPEEQEYRVLDPEGVTGIGELLKDIGDVGYDVISGIGTGAATAAGGLAGAPTGPGALGTAAAAGGGASAGFEAAKQGLGAALGLENNLNLSDIGIAGLAGAASPVLFGTGATAAQVAKKGLTGDVAEAALKAQRGLPMIGFEAAVNKVAPKVGGLLSGLPSQTVRDLSENLDDVARLGDDPQALKTFVEDQAKANLGKVDDASSKAYKSLQKHIEESVGESTIDVSSAAKAMSDKIDELSVAFKKRPSGDNRRALEDALQAFDDVWGGKPSKTLVDGKLVFNSKNYKIKPDELKSLTTSIQDLANYGDRFQFGTVKPKTSDFLERMGDGAYANLKQSVDDAAKGAKDLRSNLAKILEDKKELYKEFSPRRVLEKSQQFSSSKVQSKAWANRAKEFDKLYGTNYNKLRGTVAASNAFSKDVPLFSMKRTPGAIAGGIAGYGLARGSGQGEGFVTPGVTTGAALGGLMGGPRAIRAIIEMAKKTGGSKISPVAQRAMMPTWNIMQTSGNQEE